MLGVWRLQLLREVDRRGTIRAAAAALSITPSAVSQQRGAQSRRVRDEEAFSSADQRPLAAIQDLAQAALDGR